MDTLKPSPLDIALLLQIYSVPGYTPVDSVSRLCNNGLIEPDPNYKSVYAYPRNWRVTEKGSVYCKALYEVPLPVATWTVPK